MCPRLAFSPGNPSKRPFKVNMYEATSFFFTADITFHEMNVIPVLSAFYPFDQSTWQGQRRAGEACLGSVSEVPWCRALSVGSRGGSPSWQKSAAGETCVGDSSTLRRVTGRRSPAGLPSGPAPRLPAAAPPAGLWLHERFRISRTWGPTSWWLHVLVAVRLFVV